MEDTLGSWFSVIWVSGIKLKSVRLVFPTGPHAHHYMDLNSKMIEKERLHSGMVGHAVILGLMWWRQQDQNQPGMHEVWGREWTGGCNKQLGMVVQVYNLNTS